MDIKPYFLLHCTLLLSTCLSFYSQFNFLLKDFCVIFLHFFNLSIFTLSCSHAFLTSHPHLVLFILSRPCYTVCGILVPPPRNWTCSPCIGSATTGPPGNLSSTLGLTRLRLILMLIDSCITCPLTIRNSSHLSHGLHFSNGTHNSWEVPLPVLLSSLTWWN